MRILNNSAEIAETVGTELGVSSWVEIHQDRIDQFADATGDRQWIHIDPERAADGPFGTTIAHGYQTLALTNMLLPQIVRVENISMGVNYGADKVRFPAPVTCGSRVRAGAELAAVDPVPGGVQAKIVVTVEIDGGTKPACVVESLSRFLT